MTEKPTSANAISVRLTGEGYRKSATMDYRDAQPT